MAGRVQILQFIRGTAYGWKSPNFVVYQGKFLVLYLLLLYVSTSYTGIFTPVYHISTPVCSYIHTFPVHIIHIQSCHLSIFSSLLYTLYMTVYCPHLCIVFSQLRTPTFSHLCTFTPAVSTFRVHIYIISLYSYTRNRVILPGTCTAFSHLYPRTYSPVYTTLTPVITHTFVMFLVICLHYTCILIAFSRQYTQEVCIDALQCSYCFLYKKTQLCLIFNPNFIVFVSIYVRFQPRYKQIVQVKLPTDRISQNKTPSLPSPPSPPANYLIMSLLLLPSWYK